MQVGGRAILAIFFGATNRTIIQLMKMNSISLFELLLYFFHIHTNAVTVNEGYHCARKTQQLI